MNALFTTERLSVRKFIPDDHNDLADILTDSEVTYFEPYETFTREACIKEAINFSKSEEFFAVVLNDKVIGKIYFSDKDSAVMRSDILLINLFRVKDTLTRAFSE